MKVGHPLDPNTEVGPLAHQEHFDKVMRYMTIAQQDGATTKVGGIHRADLGNGCYVSPTLFTDADTSMHIAQEEIFGPVLTTIGFDTEEEAISIANDTDYGLSGYIWTENTGRAMRMAKHVESGMLWVNSENNRNLPSPFGGVKSSGIGRDGGDWSFDFYMETKNMPYNYEGNVELGDLIAKVANESGVPVRAHSDTTLGIEYGTLVPMRYMNEDKHFKVVSISAMCQVHDLEDSAKLGAAVNKEIEEEYDGTVAIFASGSLSHRFAQNGVADQFLHKVWSPFLENIDQRVVEMWEQGEWKEFVEMLPEYALKCHGEGFMHDTAMLLGALGWDEYKGKVEVVTPYFGSSGTGQINAIFPVE